MGNFSQIMSLALKGHQAMLSRFHATKSGESACSSLDSVVTMSASIQLINRNVFKVLSLQSDEFRMSIHFILWSSYIDITIHTAFQVGLLL